MSAGKQVRACPIGLVVRCRCHRSGRRCGRHGRAIGDGALYGLIVDVVVMPTHQGLGLGTRIVDRIIDWSARQQIPHVALAADIGVAKFYQDRWSFEESGHYLRLR
ncbi:GNAT family N-acetyltransferase [Nocardia sp. NPDC051990]|uniref:GNAT family N-acetyltransferase n=1 Tax=Nocardia sp. NPDC051990 TaxID=3155285 RepID=UPI0034135F54